MGNQQSVHSPEEVMAEKEKYLSMDQVRKRRYYGSMYTSVSDISTWTELYTTISEQDRVAANGYSVASDLNDTVSLWRGDITTLEVDAIVNSSVKPEVVGGVNKAIQDKAGQYYKDECYHNGLRPPGDIMVTGGYKLPAKYVMNTVAPNKTNEELLRACYRNSLETATKLRLTTIAFPCIATRRKTKSSFPAKQAVVIALSTVRRWLETNDQHIDRVIFCTYLKDDFKIYQKQMQRYFPLIGTTGSSSNTDNDTSQSSSSTEDKDTDRSSSDDDIIDSLDDWRRKYISDYTYRIEMNRSDKKIFLKQLYSFYLNERENLKLSPSLSFTGEDGTDLGALTREYFHDALTTLTTANFGGTPAFEGSKEDHMLPCPSKIHQQAGIYETVGKVLAHSILHNGTGLGGLSRALVFLLSHRVSLDDVETCSIPVTLDDLPDADLQAILKVGNVSNMSADDKSKLIDYLERSNIGYTRVDDTTLPFMVQELWKYEVVGRRWGQIEAMRRGMDCLGLYTYLCEHPSVDNLKQVFPSVQDLEIQPHMIFSLIRKPHPRDKIYSLFIQLVQDIYEGKLEGIDLGKLLQFWTGQPTLPNTPLQLSVDRSHEFPHAAVCFYELELPGAEDVISSYMAFQQSFVIALTHGAMGYGLD